MADNNASRQFPVMVVSLIVAIVLVVGSVSYLAWSQLRAIQDSNDRSACLDRAESAYEATLAELITAAVKDQSAKVARLAQELEDRAADATVCEKRHPIE